MRWFKHMAESHTDEKLAIILASHGLEGYGFWWLLVETIAHHTGKDDARCSVSYPVTYWMRLTGIYHVKKLKMFVECFHNLQLISAECSGNVAGMSGLSAKDVLIISMPNILKYRDEYSKKSGQNPESVRSKKQKQITETETETEIIIIDAEPMTMREFTTLFYNTFGRLMPGGLNEECRRICQTFTAERIKSAFEITAANGGEKFAYFKRVLENEKQTGDASSDLEAFRREMEAAEG